MKCTIQFFSLCILVLIPLLGCTTHDGPPRHYVSVAHIHNAVPRPTEHSRYGNQHYYWVYGHRYTVLASAKDYDKIGLASWYGRKFNGHLTSSGERYDMMGMTAASRNLPLPTYVRVTNLNNNRQVIVKVNDRGPFHSQRILDLSYAAARKLGFAKKGTARVRVTALHPTGETTYAAASSIKPYLQLGAFHHSHNANSLKEKTKKLTSAPIHIVTTGHFHRLFRVRIGPLRDEDSAKELFNELRRKGLHPALFHG